MYANLLTTALELLWWLQPAATAPGGDGGAAASGASAPGGVEGLFGCAGGGSPLMSYGYIAAMIAIFWFMVIAPQRKEQKAREVMLKTIAKGDIVRTTGGIRGEILSLTDTEVTLKIAEKTKINILRSQIAGGDTANETKDKG